MEENKKHIIVIPVYKGDITQYEKMSLRQCCKVMSKYTICLVTYKDLDCTVYYRIAQEYDIQLLRENFDEHYFAGLDAYNKLMIAKEFYLRFKNYDYMLIYQLDAYVFRDELEEWCKKGYDYIGAPWFGEYKSYEEGAKLWKVGNGGFSLRKISTYIRILTRKRPVYGVSHLWQSVSDRDFFHRCYYVLKSIFGWHNTMDYYTSQYVDQEDLFWCVDVNQYGYTLCIPNVAEAIAFSFERSPEYLYEQNNNTLPFGCHAWQKYDYESFWKKYILIIDVSVERQD